MPKSKRAKVVHTSKVTKKGKELTLKTYANIQACVPQYPYLYIFSVDHMRNTYLKDVRTQLADSRLFFGKTKVMAAALGTTASTAPAHGTHLLTPHIHGTIGLLFSPHPPEYITSYFSTFHPLDYARAGTIAPRAFALPSGILYSRGGEIPVEEDVPLSHSVEPSLRKLGVPTRLVRGKVVLGEEGGEGYVVCRAGEVLGSGQTSLLKMFGVAIAEFGVEVRAYWMRETGEVIVLEEGKGKGGGVDGEMEIDEAEGGAGLAE